MTPLRLLVLLALAGCASDATPGNAARADDVSSSVTAETFCEEVFSEAFVRDHFDVPDETPIGTENRNGRAGSQSGTCIGFWGAEMAMHPEATSYYVSYRVYDGASDARDAYEQSRATLDAADDVTSESVSGLGEGAAVERRHETRDGRDLYSSAVKFVRGTAIVTVRSAHPNAMDEFARWTPDLAADREARLLRLARAVHSRI